MVNLVRREVIETARTLVVKVGTSVLSREDDTLNLERLSALSEEIQRVRETGRRVVLVSSGAVGAGMGLLGLRQRPRNLPHLQAAAAVGQAHLIRHYDDCLKKHGCHAAQLLLNADDFDNRSRYLNVRNTILTLFENGAVPIVNENDTVSVDEIAFGDNDRLAALVTNLMHSPLLVILSTVDGLMDGPPDDPKSKTIPLVKEWDDKLLQLATADRSKRGTGGMRTKLSAVKMATAVGENVIVANGTQSGTLMKVLAGEETGTLFLAQGASVPAWKRWIGYSKPPKGKLILDAGARTAVERDGRSLLAIGIVGVEGQVEKGDVVALIDAKGNEFARGLTNYSTAEIRRLAGKRSEEIAQLYESLPYVEIVHRDNLIVTV
ncbi:Glutamate 5-kinase 1 [Symmachiella macrocystis]|uniref:Glutamate 5-kinase n=1 Tax=Symmachiella macrocystis TaxID=2527985 RepID=A0A5C6BP35_9PLAN|nr:glutamate 5-kinase [Symmachiella macrocystis]TWU13795.1 Glutamate 5-kinase 1 [Symmachiella macrocystis]